MKTYTITRVTGEPDWSAIPTLCIDCDTRNSNAGVQAWAQIAYNEEGLQVHLKAQEAHIRSEESGPTARTWEDSCLEFFFSPDPAETRYINVEAIPSGSFFLGIAGDQKNLLRLLLVNNKEYFVPRVEFFDGGWEVYYTLTYTLIRCLFPHFDPQPGQTMRANCYKCGDKTVVPHWLAWNPLDLPPQKFHAPVNFGTMIFG
jgi:hypothetical protein